MKRNFLHQERYFFWRNRSHFTFMLLMLCSRPMTTVTPVKKNFFWPEKKWYNDKQRSRTFYSLSLFTNWKIQGAFHLVKISGISGSAVNGTRLVGSSHWKIPRKSGKSKKVVPFSRLEFPNGVSCSIDVSCSLYQFQVYGRAPGYVPGFTTKWNNFLPIGNSTFATTEISGFFS